MKSKLFSLGLLGLLACDLLAQTLRPNAAAQTTFAYGDSVISTNIHYAIITANGVGVPRVEYLNVSTDKVTGRAAFYNVTNFVTVTNTAAAASSVATTSPVGLGWTNNTVLIYHHVTNDAYERRVWSTQTTTNLTVTAAFDSASAAGDRIYMVGIGGTIPIPGGISGSTGSNFVFNAAGGALWNGRAGLPLLVEVDNNTNGVLNAVSGKFQP